MQQSMPSIVPEAESDPFLMCDEFGPTPSKRAYGNDTDAGFDVAWHPHHGMDILSYMVEGYGRHADSMGNRETFASPGFQWMSVGSGIEHAEGGGTPAGQNTHGFQIWLKMPAAKMKDDPRYGTVQPDEIPTVVLGAGGIVRVIAGPLGDVGSVRCDRQCGRHQGSGAWDGTAPGGCGSAAVWVHCAVPPGT